VLAVGNAVAVTLLFVLFFLTLLFAVIFVMVDSYFLFLFDSGVASQHRCYRCFGNIDDDFNIDVSRPLHRHF